MPISPNLETVLGYLTVLSQVEANGDPERHLFARAVKEVRDLAEVKRLAGELLVLILQTEVIVRDLDVSEAVRQMHSQLAAMREEYGQ